MRRPRDVTVPGAPPLFRWSPVRLPVPACPLRRANASEEHTPPKSPKARSLRALGEVDRRAVREARPRCRLSDARHCESMRSAESLPCHLPVTSRHPKKQPSYEGRYTSSPSFLCLGSLGGLVAMALCVWGGGRPWPPHPLQESARHRPRLRLPSAGAGGVLPPDATHNCRTRRSPLHATSPLPLPGLSRRRRWGAGGVKPGGCGGEVVRR